MSEKVKSRIYAGLSVAAILISLGAAGVSAGIYRERINQNEARLDRIDQRVGVIYRHILNESYRQ